MFQSLAGEDFSTQLNVSKKMLLVIGSRRHLEWGHEKYIMEIIQSHPAQVRDLCVINNVYLSHRHVRLFYALCFNRS